MFHPIKRLTDVEKQDVSDALHGAMTRLYGPERAPSREACSNNIHLSLLTGFMVVSSRRRAARATRELLYYAGRVWIRPPVVLVPHTSPRPAHVPPQLPKDGLTALLTIMECTLGATYSETKNNVFAQFKERGFAKTLCRMHLNADATEVPLTILDSPYPSATVPPAAFIINTLTHNEALRTGAQTPAPPQEVLFDTF